MAGCDVKHDLRCSLTSSPGANGVCVCSLFSYVFVWLLRWCLLRNVCLRQNDCHVFLFAVRGAGTEFSIKATLADRNAANLSQ